MKSAAYRTDAVRFLTKGTMLHRAGMFYVGKEFTQCHRLDELFMPSDRTGHRIYLCRMQFGIEHDTDFILEPVLVPFDQPGTPVFVEGVVYERMAKYEAASDYGARLPSEPVSHLLVDSVNSKGTAINAYWKSEGFPYDSYKAFRATARQIYNDIVDEINGSHADEGRDAFTLPELLKMVSQDELDRVLNQRFWQTRATVLAETDSPQNKNWNRRWKNHHIWMHLARECKPASKRMPHQKAAVTSAG